MIVYSKLLSIGDICPQGLIPITLECTDNKRHVIMMDAAQRLYFASRLNAINDKDDKAA